MIKNDLVIEQTQKWLLSFVVKFNLCPFARREIQKKSLRLAVSDAQHIENALQDLLAEITALDKQREIETTLLIFPLLFQDFFDYLDFIDLCEQALSKKGDEGIYQIASFHPHYCFAEEDFEDVSNYTNRSPYPMVHLLREESLEKAIKSHGATEEIPQANINTMRKLGLGEIKKILSECIQSENKSE